MYVTTFYSFKGGVGRSMAMVNVAVELAQRGRRVLAVDFDLEAPGLDTFDLPRPEGVLPGVIDFVSEYLGTGRAPAVDKFVFESQGVGGNGGGLWIMPSGAHLDSYASTLASIDWGELYDRHDGYLLFEDLKEQWKHCVRPDYVFIDSRTGHTDVGGICTRQLPDAVAILFFPNEQNLRGLTKVVRDIRSEKSVSDREEIRLHFIMSNVPDLDDEDRILEKSISSFKRELDFHDLRIIHRYDSLSLLNQVVFTKDRPRSRLAKEYRFVIKEIMRYNPQDRDGVLDYIGSFRFDFDDSLDDDGNSERFRKTVERNFRNDGEVLYELGCDYESSGRLREAEDLFERAIEAGYRKPKVFLRHAKIQILLRNDIEAVLRDATNVINDPNASLDQVLNAVRIARAENLKKDATGCSGLSSRPPNEIVWIARQLNTSRAEAEIAVVMLRPLLLQTGLQASLVGHARHLLVLSSVALGRFADAVGAIQAEQQDVREMAIHDAFNYGMVLWGETGGIVREPFERVLECDRREPDEHPTPNRLQCMAVAYWALGKNREAQGLADRALQEIRLQRGREFSCWRYLQVPRIQFERDIEEIRRLVGGHEDVTPRFFVSSE